MHSGNVKAVPHSIQWHRPLKLRHGKSVPVMTEVERNFCNKNEDKIRSCKCTLNTSHSFSLKKSLTENRSKAFALSAFLCNFTELEPWIRSSFKRYVNKQHKKENRGCFPLNQKFRKLSNEAKWYRNFPGKFPEKYGNRPFYSCLLSDLAFAWQRD